MLAKIANAQHGHYDHAFLLAVLYICYNHFMLPITTLYAIIFTLFYIILSARTIRARQSTKVSLGDGAQPELLRKIRVHANFIEYVPLALILLLLAEFQAVSGSVLHSAALVLLIGRICHLYGIDQVSPKPQFRVAGMAGTFTAFGILVAALLWVSVVN